MSLRLRIEHGQDAGKTWRLPTAGVYTLGRATDASIRVLDMKVSKMHCEIQLSDKGAVFKDLQSTHGSMLNAQRVKDVKTLNPGDELRLGMTILRVLSAGDADEDAKPAAGRTASAEAAPKQQAPTTKQTLAADALVGQSMGGYEIESKIGAGGMGGVYLAEQTSLKRKVALKVLNEKFAADSAFVDQFVNEARAAGALNHPNVVQVYDVGSANGNYFFSMEVMPGGSIEDKLREGAVEWQEGLNWFIDAANALIFAEKREILHRDVKPDNLMIAEDGSAKLCDLGLAKKSEVQDLMDQGIIGTPHFISPEAIRRKPDIDGRTDLYSLGCSFFRVFTGRNPYPGKSVKEILLGHLNKPIPGINSVNRNVPKELDEIVAKLMEKDPANRFQDPAELLRSLDKVRTHYNLEAHGIKPASRKPLVIGVAAAAIAIGVAIFFATKPKDVVIERDPEAERVALDNKRRAVEQRLTGKVLKANQDQVALNGRAVGLGGDVTTENFKDSKWTVLIADYRKAAKEWDALVKSWAAEKAAAEDDIIKGYYDDPSGKLSKLASDVRGRADGYERDIKELKQDEKAIASAKAQALQEFEAAIKKLAEEVQTHFENREFIACETLLKSEKIQELSNALLQKKYKKYALGFDFEKDVVPVLDKHIPGDKKGLNRGKKIIDDAVKAIASRTDAQIRAAEDKVKGAGDPQIKDFDDAIAILEALLKELPSPTAGETKTAPQTSTAFRRARSRVETALRGLQGERQAKIFERYAADREKYFKLVKKLWAPANAGGLLNRFDLQAAVDQAELVVDLMKTDGYKKLVQEWIVTTKAVKTLFDRFHKAFADGQWTSKSFYLEDKKGKRKKNTVKAVGPEGVTWKGDVHSYTEIGPALLLSELLFVRNKNGESTGARFQCTPADHFGIAVLFEMAGDYDGATKHYKAAEAGLGNDPSVAVIRARVGRSPAEREAAEKWIAVRDWVAAQQAFVKSIEELRANGKFDAAARANLIAKADPLMRDLEKMQGMRYELLENARLAGTNWGTCLREAPHPKVAYAGEPLPDPSKREPPKDPVQPGNNVANGGGKKGADPDDPAPNGKGDGQEKGAKPKDEDAKKKPNPKGGQNNQPKPKDGIQRK